MEKYSICRADLNLFQVYNDILKMCAGLNPGQLKSVADLIISMLTEPLFKMRISRNILQHLKNRVESTTSGKLHLVDRSPYDRYMHRSRVFTEALLQEVLWACCKLRLKHDLTE